MLENDRNRLASPFTRVMKHVRKSSLTAFGVRLEENRYEILAAWIDRLLMGGRDRMVLYLSLSKFSPVFEEMRDCNKDLLTIVDATSMSIDDLLADMERKCKIGETLFFVDVLWAFSMHESTSVLNFAMDTIRIKKFALAKGITLIVTKFLRWNLYDRDGVDANMPMLRDFEDEDYLASIADCVVSLYTPSTLNIFMDEKGNDLRDVTIFRILKSPMGPPVDFKAHKMNSWEYYMLPDDGA